MGALGGLAGCAGFLSHPGRLARPPPPPPPTRDGAFVMPDGASLPFRAWMPEVAPRAVLLALHGFGDSRDAWELPAPVFSALGYALFAPDQRGFGETAARGLWVGTERMVDDAASIMARLRAVFPATPIYLIGESMGGAVAMCCAARRPAGLAGTVLVAPAVWGRASMDVLLRVGLWLVSGALPGVVITDGGPVHVRATDNLPALRRFSRDPLTVHGTRFATLRGLVDLMDSAVAAAPRMPTPTLALYGAHDEVIPPAATAAAWRALPPPPDARRAFYPEGFHLLLRDLQRSSPIGDIAAWLADPAAPLPSGADRAASMWLSDQA